MTLQEIINQIKITALNNPLVQTFVENVDDVSTYHNLKYGCVAVEQGTIGIDDKGWLTWNGGIYYIDRVVDDTNGNPSTRKVDNSLEIQSKAIIILQNLIKNLGDIGIESVTYQVFTHEFLDYCAGAMAQVSLRTPLSVCWDDFYDGEYYTVTITATHGVAVGSGRYRAGSVCTARFFPSEGYHFEQWSDGNTQNPRSFVVNQDITLGVDGVIDTFTLDVEVNHGGVSVTVDGEPVQLPYTGDYGTNVIVSVTPDTGYRFVAWDDGNRNATRTVVLVRNIDLYTSCIPEQKYAVVVTAEHGTTTGTGAYSAGESVEISVTADEHYHFVRWNDGDTNPTRTIVVSRDINYHAICSIDQYTVTATTEHGTVTGGGVKDYGSECVLTWSAAGERYHFVRWSDGITVNPHPSFTVTQNVSIEAIVTEDLYVISADAENGDVVGYVDGVEVELPYTANYGEIITLHVTPSEGYSFVRWSDGSIQNPRSIQIVQSGNYHAICAYAELYTVNFNCTNGSVVATVGGNPIVSGTQVSDGTEVVFAITPNPHYHYSGTNPETIVVHSNVTKNYVCDIDQHTITASATNGTVVGGGTYNYGTSIQLIVVPNEGYSFVRWTDGNTQNPRPITVTGDAAYSAICESAAVYHTVTFSCSHGSVGATVDGVGIQSPAQVVEGKTVRFVITPDSGYEYTGTNPEDVVVNADVTKNYVCTPAVGYHTVNFSCTNGHVYASVDGAIINPGASVQDGKTVEFNIYPNEGYEYTGTNPEYVVVTEDITKSYVCTEIPATTHLLTFNGVNGSCSPASFRGNQGATVWVTVSPNSGYRFSQWNDGLTSNPRQFTVGDHDETFTATCEQAETFVVNATGINGAVTGSGTYAYGDTCTLTFTPNQHYHFVGWSDGTTSNPYSFTVTNDVIISCTGIIDQHTVTLTGYNCTVHGSGIYNYGTQVSISAVPTHGYDWIGWSDGDQNQERTITVDGDIELYAVCYQLAGYVYVYGATYCKVGGESLEDIRGYYFVESGSSVEFGLGPYAGVGGSYKIMRFYRDAQFEVRGTSITWNCYRILQNHTCSASFDSAFSSDVRIYRYFTDGGETFTINATATNGTVTGGGIYPYGSEITLEVTPNEGYQFYRWDDEIRDNPRSVLVLRDDNYVAECTVIGSWTGLRMVSSGETSVTFVNAGEFIGTWPVQYSMDGGTTWNYYTLGNTINLSNGDSICWKGTKSSHSQQMFGYRYFVMSGTGSIAASGDITSLLNGEGGVMDLTFYGENTFMFLFARCTIMSSLPSLPSITLTSGCYYGMFNGCTMISNASPLPATVLAYQCYRWMFSYCTNLVSAPALPATTLAEECYYGMFTNCGSLINAPSLPATTLAEECYGNMFGDCVNLVHAPSLPAITLASECYGYMFINCTSLTGSVNLSATSPYYEGTTTACPGMFSNTGGGTIYVGGGTVSQWKNAASIDTNVWDIVTPTEQDSE